MGKSWRKDAKNDNWRRAKHQKSHKNKGGRPQPQEDEHPGWVGQRGGMIVSGVCPT
jgi:hypothetical protein